jgi:hypothetical protein
MFLRNVGMFPQVYMTLLLRSIVSACTQHSVAGPVSSNKPWQQFTVESPSACTFLVPISGTVGVGTTEGRTLSRKSRRAKCIWRWPLRGKSLLPLHGTVVSKFVFTLHCWAQWAARKCTLLNTIKPWHCVRPNADIVGSNALYRYRTEPTSCVNEFQNIRSPCWIRVPLPAPTSFW